MTIFSIRKSKLIGFACSMLLLGYGSIYAQTGNVSSNNSNAVFTLENIQAVSSGEELSMPVWSPNGDKLLVATSHGMMLKMIDLNARNNIKEISKCRGAGFEASWSADGEKVFFRYKENEKQIHPEIKSISLSDGKMKSSNLHPNGLMSASKAIKGNDPIVFVNVENLDIEAQTKDESKCWSITDFDGQFYRPVLSPDKKTVIVHEKSEMYLFAADGSGLIKHLGTGLASSWSPDGKYVLAFLDESNNGHTISGSELYLIDIDAGKMTQFTHTEGVNEMWPNWSNDGSKIAYEDEISGKIFVADIVKK